MIKQIKISLFILLVLFCFKSEAQISSTFGTTAEGWTTPNDADGTIGYSATGGNPGGFVFGSPFVINLGSGSLYAPYDFVAPVGYRGNMSAYYNGTLRYDIQLSSAGVPNQYPEVTIANNAGVILYYFPPTSNQPVAAPSWSTFSVVMNNALSYWKTTNSATGAAASEAQMQSILTDLAALQIRGLYRDANVTSRLDNVTFMPPLVVTTQPTSRVVCDGATTTLTTAATGNANITYQWQKDNSPTAGWVDITNTGGYSGATSATLTVNTTGNFGGGTYRCKISGTAVNDAFSSSASITVNPNPTAPTTTGSSSCVSASLTLSASGGIAGQYRWYTAATGGVALVGQTSSTFTTPVLTITTTYYVSINNGTCESARTPVVATITTTPSTPVTTGNSSCGPASLTLSAAGGTNGQYRWYTTATGGTALAGETNSTYTTALLSLSTTYYVSINNGTCEGARAAVTATINTIPAAPSTTGNYSCGAAAITLSASGGTAGQYRWYASATGGTAIVGQTGNTYTTSVISITTTYYVSINNGTCESARTAVIATVNTVPTAPTTTGNSSCGPAAIALNAAGGTAGQYRWYTTATGGTALTGQTNSTYTTPVISITTTYYVSINDGTCESARAAVIATINTVPTAPTVTGNSSCGPAAILLNAAGGTAGQYRWYTTATGGTAITGQTNSAYTTPVISITTIYYVSINNGSCESSRTAVIATVNTIPTAPTTIGSSSCGSAALTLTAAGGTAGQYRWYTVATGGTAIVGQTSNTYVTSLLTLTTTYYVSINNGTCESARTAVVATIATTPAAPSTLGGTSCGPAAITLTAAGGTNGQYRWYTAATGGTAITGQTNNTYTTPSLSTTTTYYVSINNGTCEGARTAVTATVNTIPSAPTSIGNSFCGAAALVLTASGGTAGQYRWYNVPTGGTSIAAQTNSTYTTPVISTTTTYYVSINNGVCESPRVATVATINPIPAKPTITASEPIGAGIVQLCLKAITLTAPAGFSYTWSNGATTQQITAVQSGSFSVIVKDPTGCSSVSSDVIQVVANNTCVNNPPVINTSTSITSIGGSLSIDLSKLLSDPDNNLNLSSLQTVGNKTEQGGQASINALILNIDYSGLRYAGTDAITISVCDELNVCIQQVLTIEVIGDINIFNGISPNGDGKNDNWIIEYIDLFHDTQKNKVTLYNRWGDVVWEGENYNNDTVVFTGISKNGNELATGSYFYKIEFNSGREGRTGYLSLKR